MKAIRLLCLLLCLLLCPLAAPAEEPASFFDDAEADSVGRIMWTYDSQTLKYTIEKFTMDGEVCYLTRVWVRDPAKQIRKAAGEWKKKLEFPMTLAGRISGAVIVINGSGYVSPSFPEIPENYPGESRDYWYTPLGSLTVTDRQVFRILKDVPYSGLTLDDGGLKMYVNKDSGAVLATCPIQTWAFYPDCPMMRNNKDILPEEWIFADRRAERTIIARVDRNNYLILSATLDKGRGISLRRAVTFFQENFSPFFLFFIDSSAILRSPVRKDDQQVGGFTCRG